MKKRTRSLTLLIALSLSTACIDHAQIDADDHLVATDLVEATPDEHARRLFAMSAAEQSGDALPESLVAGAEGLDYLAWTAAVANSYVDACDELGRAPNDVEPAVLELAANLRAAEYDRLRSCVSRVAGDEVGSCFGVSVEQNIPPAGGAAGGAAGGGWGGPVVLLAWVIASEVVGSVADDTGYYSDPEVLNEAGNSNTRAQLERMRSDRTLESTTRLQDGNDKLIEEMLRRRANSGRLR